MLRVLQNHAGSVFSEVMERALLQRDIVHRSLHHNHHDPRDCSPGMTVSGSTNNSSNNLDTSSSMVNNRVSVTQSGDEGQRVQEAAAAVQQQQQVLETPANSMLPHPKGGYSPTPPTAGTAPLSSPPKLSQSLSSSSSSSSSPEIRRLREAIHHLALSGETRATVAASDIRSLWSTVAVKITQDGSLSAATDMAPTWVPDRACATCMGCAVRFTLTNRRHHCRGCGGVFCGSCASAKKILPRLGFQTPVRVCGKCFNQ